jgi:hypothetical protein
MSTAMGMFVGSGFKGLMAQHSLGNAAEHGKEE